MAHYELFFIMRRMSKSDTVACLKRTAEYILDNNGILRKIENLGTKSLAYRINNKIPNKPKHSSGTYFLYHFDLPPAKMPEFKDKLFNDVDLIRNALIKKNIPIPPEYECTLHEELMPAVYRKPVQRMIEESRKNRERMGYKDYDHGTKLILR